MVTVFSLFFPKNISIIADYVTVIVPIIQYSLSSSESLHLSKEGVKLWFNVLCKIHEPRTELFSLLNTLIPLVQYEKLEESFYILKIIKKYLVIYQSHVSVCIIKYL